MMVARTTLVLWKNLVLKHHNAVLTEVKTISFESPVKLRIPPAYERTELFPPQLVLKAAEKSLRVLHDEAIKKAVVFERHLLQSFSKRQQFLSLFSFRSKLNNRCLEPPSSSGTSSREGTSTSKASSSSNWLVKG